MKVLFDYAYNKVIAWRRKEASVRGIGKYFMQSIYIVLYLHVHFQPGFAIAISVWSTLFNHFRFIAFVCFYIEV